MVDNVYMMAFGYSLALVSAGSALHALWNVLVKRSGTSDVAFVWVYSAITAPLWLVVLTVGAIWGGLGPAWWAALVSTALHTAYAAVLQRAYSAADLSVVYPVSRGLAPVLVTAVVAPAGRVHPRGTGWRKDRHPLRTALPPVRVIPRSVRLHHFRSQTSSVVLAFE